MNRIFQLNWARRPLPRQGVKLSTEAKGVSQSLRESPWRWSVSSRGPQTPLIIPSSKSISAFTARNPLRPPKLFSGALQISSKLQHLLNLEVCPGVAILCNEPKYASSFSPWSAQSQRNTHCTDCNRWNPLYNYSNGGWWMQTQRQRSKNSRTGCASCAR